VTPNNRAHARVATNLSAHLLSTDGRCNLTCSVTDLSEHGARVKTRHDAFVPDRVFLCELRWSRDNELGLLFLDRPGRACRQVLMDHLRRRQPA
jgi:hypothetical protein